MADRHLLVTYVASFDGEQLHPMDTCVVRVDLDDDDQPTAESLARMTARLAAEVARKAKAGPRHAAPEAQLPVTRPEAGGRA